METENWSTEQVVHWLRESSIPVSIQEIFNENDIDGEVILSDFMTSENLKNELGIDAFGVRCKLMDRIRKLKDCSEGPLIEAIRERAAAAKRTVLSDMKNSAPQMESSIISNSKAGMPKLGLSILNPKRLSPTTNPLTQAASIPSMLKPAKEAFATPSFIPRPSAPEISPALSPTQLLRPSIGKGGNNSGKKETKSQPVHAKPVALKDSKKPSIKSQVSKTTPPVKKPLEKKMVSVPVVKRTLPVQKKTSPPYTASSKKSNADDSFEFDYTANMDGAESDESDYLPIDRKEKTPKGKETSDEITPTKKRGLESASSDDSVKKNRPMKLSYAEHCEELCRCFLQPGDLNIDEAGIRKVFKWMRDPKQDLSLEDKAKLYLNLYFDVTLEENLDPFLQAGLQHLLVAKTRLLPDFKCVMVRDFMPQHDYKVFAMRGAIPEALLQNLGISVFFMSNYPGRAVVGTFSAKTLISALEKLSPEAEQKYHSMNKMIEKFLLRM